jgi:tetratricopeptide (TPR) repeat protein
MKKALKGVAIATDQEFYEAYANFLNQFITSCIDRLWKEISFLEISTDEKKLFMEHLICTFHRVNNRQINEAFRHYAKKLSQDNNIGYEVDFDNEATSCWQEDFITLLLLKYMTQSNDKVLREEGVQKLLCCGKDLIEAMQYQQALRLYGEIKICLKETDTQLKQTLAQSFRDCSEILNLFWNNYDNKTARLMSFSAMEHASDLEPIHLDKNAKNAALLINSYIGVDKTVEAVALAEQLDQSKVFSKFLLAHAYECAGNYDDAITSIQSVLANPSIPSIYEAHLLNSLASCYHLKGNYEQAVSTLKAIIRIEDDHILEMKYSAYARLCWIYGDLGDYSTAIVVGEEASSLYSRAELFQFRTEYNNLGVIYLQMEDYDTARHYFKMCVEGFPENWSSRRWLYWIDIKMDRLANAKNDIELIIPKRWKPSAEHSSLGLIYFLQGNIDAARREWSCALEFCSNYSLQDKLNRIYLQSLLEHPDSESEIHNLLTYLQPPSSLLEWSILSNVTILSRSSTQLEGINRLVRLIHQYKNRS